jgi:hypothetical protein
MSSPRGLNAASLASRVAAHVADIRAPSRAPQPTTRPRGQRVLPRPPQATGGIAPKSFQFKGFQNWVVAVVWVVGVVVAHG